MNAPAETFGPPLTAAGVACMVQEAWEAVGQPKGPPEGVKESLYRRIALGEKLLAEMPCTSFADAVALAGLIASRADHLRQNGDLTRRKRRQYIRQAERMAGRIAYWAAQQAGQPARRYSGSYLYPPSLYGIEAPPCSD